MDGVDEDLTVENRLLEIIPKRCSGVPRTPESHWNICSKKWSTRQVRPPTSFTSKSKLEQIPCQKEYELLQTISAIAKTSAARAAVAIAHTLLLAVFAVLKTLEPYRESLQPVLSRKPTSAQSRLYRQLQQLGYDCDTKTEKQNRLVCGFI